MGKYKVVENVQKFQNIKSNLYKNLGFYGWS